MSTTPPTLFHWLRTHAERRPDARAFVFLSDGAEEGVTFGGLETSAMAIGAELQSRLAPRSRALLLYPPGMDFVRAFFACLAADVVPVPCYPPDPARLGRTLPRVLSIINDSGATACLTTQMIAGFSEMLADQAPVLKTMAWVATDAIDPGGASAWRDPQHRAHSIAFLQYTSGSTGTPRGVSVTHTNLTSNTDFIQRRFRLDEASQVVTWLPLYHDMGLIGHVLATLRSGSTSYLMSPLTFLQHPFRWLEAISRFRGTVSGAPNFAYDLCVRKVSPEQRQSLDLSCWGLAYNGAEPIHVETLERFGEAFEPCGFSRRAFLPCYGLAEQTLMASCVDFGTGAYTLAVDPDALREGRVRSTDPGGGKVLVSSGLVPPESKIVIADPDKLRRARPGQIGEIWIHSPFVCAGYWNRTEETEECFHAQLGDTQEGPFLRTGDLGFLHQGHLFVTGRAKDLIIVHGQNHYPQDIEGTAEGVHPAVRRGCSAAFAVDGTDDEEHVALVAEVDADKAGDLEELVTKIRHQISSVHGLTPAAVVLIAPKSALKTSSGKIQRRATKAAWLAGELDVVLEKRQSGFGPAEGPPKPAPPAPAPVAPAAAVGAVVDAKPLAAHGRSAQAIEAFIRERVAAAIEADAASLDPAQTFADLGLGSVDEVEISAALEEWLGVTLAPTLTWDYPTIRRLARHLAGEAVEPVMKPKKS